MGRCCHHNGGIVWVNHVQLGQSELLMSLLLLLFWQSHVFGCRLKRIGGRRKYYYCQ